MMMDNYNIISLDGATSIIYDIGNNYAFKIFNPEYRNLSIEENLNIYKMIMKLAYLNHIDGYVKPEILVLNNNYFYGYIMKKINGPSLENIPLETELSYLILGLEKLKEPVKKLSEQHIIFYDLNLGSIICDKQMHLIDLDLSYLDFNKSTKEIYFYNMINLFEIIRNILADYSESIFDDPLLSYYEDLYNGFLSDDFTSYFNHLIHIVEDKANTNVITIKDFKNALQLLKKKKVLYKRV